MAEKKPMKDSDAETETVPAKPAKTPVKASSAEEARYITTQPQSPGFAISIVSESFRPSHTLSDGRLEFRVPTPLVERFEKHFMFRTGQIVHAKDAPDAPAKD